MRDFKAIKPTKQFTPRILRLAAGLCVALAMLAVSVGVVRADDVICVVCKGPDLTYRCKVLRESGIYGGRDFQFYCITEIAREGGHQSCSVKRQSSRLCEGLDKTLVYNGRAPVAPANGSLVETRAGEPLPNADPGATLPAGDVAGDPAGEPRTLMELTDQTVKGTKKQLKKTGDAIGGAAKKTGNAIGGAAKKTGDTVVGAAKKTGQTITGAAKKTGTVVGGVVKKSGNAIGSAAKSTLNCVTSLFSNCF